MTPPEQGEKLADAPPAGPSWLAVTAMLADVVFEADCIGRFTNFGPGKPLGFPAARLLGSEMSGLITALPGHPADAAAQFTAVFSTICAQCVAWQGSLRLNRADGTQGNYRLSLAPRFAAGNVTGVYGMLCELDPAPVVAPPIETFGDPRAPVMLDAETGLWTARIFAEELARRLDRLDVEEHPGTLLYLGFCRAAPALVGATAMRLAEELRDIVRPTDLLGRIDATTLALWCDGMDHLTGGERAAKFCGQFPAVMPERATITAGVATRWPGSTDDPGTMMERAAVALRLADLATDRIPPETRSTGAWRVWQQD
jgi:GGDEF domain-containing protein